MQFDSTRIAIRERDFGDILDLALQVVWRFRGPLAATFLLGVLPFAIANGLLIGWMAQLDEGGESASRLRYVWVMAQLVLLEWPLATVLMTAFLGDAVFNQQANWRRAAGHLKEAWPTLLWTLGVLRPGLAGLALALFIPRYEPWEFGGPETWLPFMCVYAVGIRIFRPFLPEMVLLERKRLRATAEDAVTLAKRSSNFHNIVSSDLFSRWLAAAAVALLLLVSLSYNGLLAPGFFLGNWRWSPALLHLWIPVAMWLVAGYFAVVRFLNYLDLRIRYEGWEVELRMRAEAARLHRRLEGPRLHSQES